MRVWDIAPGYLNRQSLLGEHRELHGLHSILANRKSGYSRHPETIRWLGCESGLARRHAYLAAEMSLRGYSDRTPLREEPSDLNWPGVFVTPPSMQYALLAAKYRGRERGRIPLPRSPHELWAHHKYSVMARDPATYRAIGRRIARLRGRASLSHVTEELVVILRQEPPRGNLTNALEHMWGYVSKAATSEDRQSAMASVGALLLKTRELAVVTNEPYLLRSTALSDLAVFVLVPETGTRQEQGR